MNLKYAFRGESHAIAFPDLSHYGCLLYTAQMKLLVIQDTRTRSTMSSRLSSDPHMTLR